MMIKLSKIPGVRTVKGFGELFKHVTEEMHKIHEITLSKNLRKISPVKQKVGR